MSQRICLVDGCGSTVRCRGWCTKHYGRWKVTGDPLLTPSGRVHRTPELCAIEGCQRPRRKRDWCETHYSRWQRNGSPDDSSQAWVVVDVAGCVICGDPVPEGIGFRRYCSRSCATINARGGRDKSRQCVLCGEEFSLLIRSPRTGRRKYSSASTCAKCGKPSGLRRHLAALIQRDGSGCGICGDSVDIATTYPDPESPSVDHVHPRSLGGPDHLSNYQLTHLICNVRKQNRVEVLLT